MGRILHLPDVTETAMPAGRCQPLNGRLAVPDAEHSYGEWIAGDASA